MRKIEGKILASMLIGMLIVSCNEKSVDTEGNHGILSEKTQYIDDGRRGLPILEEISTNQISPNSLEVTYPKESILFYSHNGILMKSNGGSVTITCTCQSGKGDCSPVAAFNKYFCAMGSGCNTCDRKVEKGQQPIEFLGYEQENISPVRFVVDQLTADDPVANAFETTSVIFRNCPTDLMLNTETSQSLLDLYTLIYNGEIPLFILNNEEAPSSGYQYVEVDFYGNLIYVPVTDAFVQENPSLKVNLSISSGSASCDCKSGSSGCELKSKFGAKYCEAGSCKSCSLKV